MKKTILGLSIIGSVFLTGCVFAPGGGDNDYSRPPRIEQATIGQELLDLDRAFAAGVINQEEFERAKARVLEGRARN